MSGGAPRDKAGLMNWIRRNSPTREELLESRFIKPFAHRVAHSHLWRFTRTSVRRGTALDDAYETARRLQSDGEDLIQKAVGWMLREAGKADPVRLERFLRREGRRTPRTTLRYAIERFPPVKRRELLASTRGDRA